MHRSTTWRLEILLWWTQFFYATTYNHYNDLLPIDTGINTCTSCRIRQPTLFSCLREVTTFHHCCSISIGCWHLNRIHFKVLVFIFKYVTGVALYSCPTLQVLQDNKVFYLLQIPLTYLSTEFTIALLHQQLTRLSPFMAQDNRTNSKSHYPIQYKLLPCMFILRSKMAVHKKNTNWCWSESITNWLADA